MICLRKPLSSFFHVAGRTILATAAVVAGAASAGSLSISNVPLGTGTGISVRPNLVFILDDSGSMHSEYMPDYMADEEICPDTNNSGGGDTDECVVGDPPYSSAAMNTVYYNPAIRYRPPMKADGTEFANASTTTPYSEFYPLDSSGVPASASTLTLSSYQNAAWCKLSTNTPSGNPATDTNCAYYPVGTAFNDYPKYPNATYKYRKTYAGPPVYYTMSGSPQWCSSSALISCQAKRTSTYKYPKFSESAEVAGVAASRTFLVVKANTGDTVSFICFNDDGDHSNGCQGTNLLSSPITIPNGNDKRKGRQYLANALKTLALPAGWKIEEIKADTSGNNDTTCTDAQCAQLKITAPGGATSTTNEDYNKNLNLKESGTVDFKNANGTLAGGINYSPAAGAVSFTGYQISSGNTYTKYDPTRTDCAGSSCTYAEELQNFANWYQFYRRRMAMTKTAISRAFAGISDTAPGAGFRIGLMTISAGAASSDVGASACYTTNKNLEVDVSDFVQTHKNTFYTNLFQIKQCSWTPLRGALSRAGRLYAGQNVSNGGTVFTDPVQYSCQQNFAFLSTDGYWNNDIEGSSFGPKKVDGSTDVGDQDGTSATNKDGSSVSVPQLDSLNISNTLADVAFYYYNTDLRTSMGDDVPKSSRDQAAYQHMVTFTMGLGVNGSLAYDKNYEYGASPDYIKIQQGTLPWTNTNTDAGKIDDLWHAAVNGRGKYFSASSPDEISSSLTEALVGVSAMGGSGAAAATSNLEPVAGDNYAYVASYVTQTWEGNIEARTIDLTTGVLSSSATWSAQSLLDTQAATATIPVGATGPGTRKLYTYDSTIAVTDKKMALTWANAVAKGWDAAASDYFNPGLLSQCPSVAINCPGATRENLFNYLMGGADTTTDSSYRSRVHVLGDIVSSQPVYIRKPPFSYTDAGYDTFKSGNESRKAMVYVGANDGFLHAFDANTGNEDWAYAPRTIIPELYQLAASNYTHRYYVDGTITAGDIKVGSDWKSILVGGLNAGGKSYYALDVTDPAVPLALWEFSDPRMGYTFGNPIITKLPTGATSAGGANISGKWVVLLTSGYNNGGTTFGTHDGQGVLYVLDAYTGTEYFRLYTCTNQNDDTTCAGTSASPNGLAKINSWANNPSYDNTSLYAYGGDLDGNMWRFDLAGKSAFVVANVGEPISVKPELSEVSGKQVVFFGTGLFLQGTDKSDATRRSIYAISDDLTATSALTNVKTSGALVEQTMAVLPSDTTLRTIDSPAPVNWGSDRGWFVTLLEDRERVNVDPKIQLGTLVVASNVPDAGVANACTTGGHAWINYLDITTGGFVVNSQSNPNAVSGKRIANALAVGVNVVKLPNGKLITIVTTSDNQHPVTETPVGTANLPLKRISWRELVTD